MNAICELNPLTFEYRLTNLAKLIFTHSTNPFRSSARLWRRTVEVIITDAPAPQYSEPLSWDDLHVLGVTFKEMEVNLLEWLIDSLTRLSDDSQSLHDNDDLSMESKK